MAKPRRVQLAVFCALLTGSLSRSTWSTPEEIVPGVLFVGGPTNGVVVERDGKRLAVYGDPDGSSKHADVVLFTHHRRDVLWAGRSLVDAGARAIAPEGELRYFRDVESFWRDFQKKRFHDYAQQSTKIIRKSLPVSRAVKGGDSIAWQGLEIHVIDTPGMTRGAVSYLVELGGVRMAFVGDLIYGDGKLLDLYSLQDAIPEAKIGGYHGYAARLSQVIQSLDHVLERHPDILVPARGPVIRDPKAAVARLTERARAFYENYLSIDALRWYFKDEHIEAKARRVLGDANVQWMPLAETVEELPSWLVKIANTRLIISEDGAGLLIDCGGDHIVRELERLEKEGRLRAIEHVFITHYHDDHTNRVAQVAEQHGATVHASRQTHDVLERPGAYRLPAMTDVPVHVSARHDSGDRWEWKGFDIRLFYFPGQTLYHDALLVRKGGDEVFFIGDSFTPSGIDDYCLLNRNFLHAATGYPWCLEFVRDRAPRAFLVNQHVDPMFRYSPDQLEHMLAALHRRVDLLRPLVPFDDVNWGLDEGWARFYPYAATVRRGDHLDLEVRLFNHSPKEQLFRVGMHLPAGWGLSGVTPEPLRLTPRREGAVRIRIETPEEAAAGLHVLTADIRFGEWDLREWTEALVTVEE